MFHFWTNCTRMVFYIALYILVLVLEILNTVVENLVDLLVKKEYHIEAKKGKGYCSRWSIVSAGFELLLR